MIFVDLLPKVSALLAGCKTLTLCREMRGTLKLAGRRLRGALVSLRSCALLVVLEARRGTVAPLAQRKSCVVSRLWLGIAGGWLVGLLLFPGGAAAAKRPSCEVPRSKTYLANQAVRVFTTRHRAETSFGSAVYTVLRACHRPHGRPFELARNTAVDTGGYNDFANVELSGRHVALTARSCDRHGMFCVGGVLVWNVRTRRVVRSTDWTWASDLELHPNGSVAWITAPASRATPATEAEVRVNDRAGERTLATGAIAADSLALGGSILYWTEAGVPHASTLQ